MKVIDTVKDYAIITFATIWTATAVFFFLIPSQTAVGGITGLAIVLSNVIPLSVSTISLIMNVILLILAFMLLGKEFGIKTAYTSLLTPIIVGIYERVFPNNQSLTGSSFIDVILYCFFVGVPLAILFNRNASSGGIDIVAKLLNKFFRMELGSALSAAGICVAVSAIFVYNIEVVAISIFGTYLNGLVVDHFIFGSTQKKRVCILSQKEEDIKNFILHELHSGATIYECRGAYENNIRHEILTIVDKNEYVKLMNYITKVDEKAFVTVYAVNEVLYTPKLIPNQNTKLFGGKK